MHYNKEWDTTEIKSNIYLYIMCLEYAVVQWLRYCATNRKVTGSPSDGVIGVFH
jgi:hypothetical protein